MTRNLRPLFVATLLALGPCAAPAPAQPFDQCGTYFQGLEGCVLFQPDAGGPPVLPEATPQPVGTRARVRGDLQPCPSFCFAPCVFGAQISACGGSCAADFDRNGTLNTADIFAFLQAWFAGNISADFDHSGGLAVADIFGFIGAWFAGC